MSESTNIEWANHTGGPYFGCDPVSPGCVNCYAWELAESRLEPLFRRAYKAAGFADWETRPVWGRNATRVLSKGFWKDAVRINKMHASRGTRGRWFPSMIDWLDEMPGGIIDLEGKKLETAAVMGDFLKLIHDTPNVDWLLLTKRPENFERCIEEAFDHTHGEGWQSLWTQGEPPANVWIGTSTEDQERADERIPEMLKIPARLRFLSVEPLLGPIEFSDVSKRGDAVEQLGRRALEGIDWVIVGGESGSKARPCNVEWIRGVMKQCQAAGVACFVKQLGARPMTTLGMMSEFPEWREVCHQVDGKGDRAVVEARLKHAKGGDINEWPEDLRVREFPQVDQGSAEPRPTV
jgi:protein gp37